MPQAHREAAASREPPRPEVPRASGAILPELLPEPLEAALEIALEGARKGR